MILEQEQLVDRIALAIAESLIRCAIQNPTDDIVTTVVPHWADGDLVCIEGVIDIHQLARAIADEVER